MSPGPLQDPAAHRSYRDANSTGLTDRIRQLPPNIIHFASSLLRFNASTLRLASGPGSACVQQRANGAQTTFNYISTKRYAYSYHN